MQLAIDITPYVFTEKSNNVENTLVCLSVERGILIVFQSMCLSQFETLFYLMCMRYDILVILIKKYHIHKSC